MILNFALYSQGFVNLSGSGNSVLRETEYSSVDGSPYFFKDFKMGGILDKSGKLSDNLLVRYDSYRDEIQFLRDEKTLVIEPALAPEFYVMSQESEGKGVAKLVFRNGFKIDGFTERNYFQVLHDGDSKFLKRIKTSYVEEIVNNYGTNEQVKRFVRTELYFFILSGESKPITKARKDIHLLFGDSSSVIKNFIKENKLSVKNDADLVKVLRKFDELKSN